MAKDLKNSPPPREGRTAHPLMLGMIIGLLMGIVIALAVALWLNRLSNPFVDKAKPIEPAREDRPHPAAQARLMMLAPLASAANLKHIESSKKQNDFVIPPGKIKFAVININHPHIYGMADAIKRGGGELVSVYAKEADLLAAFVKTYPDVKQAKSENEILEPSIQLVLSSGIPDERAPLGIKVMQHDKDYLTDKPGIITLKQLAEVKRVQ